jgi:hypothetical protein
MIGVSENIYNTKIDSRADCKVYWTKTNSMELSPFGETDSRSASLEILCLLWILKIHYRVYKNPPLVPTLSKIKLVHTFQPVSLKSIFILSSIYT